MGKPVKSIVGQRFGRLTVTARADDYVSPKGKHIPRWLCACDCGGSNTVPTSILLNSRTLSCGCLRAEKPAHNRTHGMTGTPEYGLYRSMIARCTNPNCPAYPDYGGRGITVDQRWLGQDGFDNFREDMGPKPTPAHTLERMDTNNGYSPGNCRWDTRTAQARNTRANRMIAINGVIRCVAEWAEISGVPSSAIYKRMLLGWPLERLLEPSRAHR